MPITCHCDSCGGAYQVGEQYAGRKIKCPKCAAPILVGGKSETSRGPVKPPGSTARPPAHVSAAKPEAVRPTAKPAASEPARAEAAHPRSSLVRALPLDEPVPSPAPAAGVEQEQGSPAAIPGLDESLSRPRHLPGDHPKKKKRADNTMLWIGLGLGGAGLLVAAAIIVGVIWTSGRNPTDTASTSGSPDGGKKTPDDTPTSTITIDWPASDRQGGKIFIDGEEKEVPAKGVLRYSLPARKKAYQFRLVRPNFQAVEFRPVFAEDQDPLPFTPSWLPLPRNYDDWLQDLDAAKRLAGKESKGILILFDQSGTPASRQLLEEIFSKYEFREKRGVDYVLVYVDVAKPGETRPGVQDAQRNARTSAQFSVAAYPTIIVTDKDGQPIGCKEGYPGNLNSFYEVLDEWRQVGLELQGLTKQIASADGEKKKEAILKAMNVLEMNGLARFYEPSIKQWSAVVPAGDVRAVTREMAQEWAKRFERAQANAEATKRIVAEFARWKKDRECKDRDLWAGLHALAAGALMRNGLRAEAGKLAKEGLAVNPSSRELRAFLNAIQRAAGQSGEAMPVGAGTGFCVAPGGYILTNHHVIDRAKTIHVRLHKQKNSLAAKLVASNADGDIALLKVDLPEGVELKPVVIVPGGVKAAEEVCALGFPGVSDEGANLIVTKGIVSSVPDEKEENAKIVTDCRVNPGNSGGPLCNTRGAVVGMVSAKSRISSREDSYGLVIPAGHLRKFLAKHSEPEDEDRVVVEPIAKVMTWAEVHEKLAPSVVYIENLQ